MSEIQLSIVVPCYNEEDNIANVVQHFKSALGDQKGVELILIDNGSTDSTGQRIDEEIEKQRCDFARKAHVAVNQGYGHGVLSGLKEARGNVLAWTHADLQTDPADVLRAYEVYQQALKKSPRVLVKGHRKNRKISEKVLSFGMQLLSSLALGMWIEEVNAQPKLFPREFLNSMAEPPHDFSLDLYVLYLANKNDYNIIPLPVYFKDREFGEAKGGGGADLKGKWKLIKRTVSYIIELKSKLKA